MCFLVLYNWWSIWLSRGHSCIYLVYWSVSDCSEGGIKHFNLVRLSPFANDLCLGCRAVAHFNLFSTLFWFFHFTRLFHVLPTCAHSNMDTEQCIQCVDDWSLPGYPVPTWSCHSHPKMSGSLANPPLSYITDYLATACPKRIKLQSP